MARGWSQLCSADIKLTYLLVVVLTSLSLLTALTPSISHIYIYTHTQKSLTPHCPPHTLPSSTERARRGLALRVCGPQAQCARGMSQARNAHTSVGHRCFVRWPGRPRRPHRRRGGAGRLEPPTRPVGPAFDPARSSARGAARCGAWCGASVHGGPLGRPDAVGHHVDLDRRLEDGEEVAERGHLGEL